MVTQGDNEALCQVFFCYKDAKKGVIPGCHPNQPLFVGRPFTREIIITEKFSNEVTHATFDGEGHDIKKVEQLTGLKVRYLPPGAVVVEDKKPAERAKPAKPAKPAKAEKAEKAEKSAKPAEPVKPAKAEKKKEKKEKKEKKKAAK